MVASDGLRTQANENSDREIEGGRQFSALMEDREETCFPSMTREKCRKPQMNNEE